ncbi:ABC transporter ATP-binding protein [Marinoscillum sp. MHG1-6]|uniref:ABC transporter ATP-binding protein n=1 Tax=Marinoscillum sp. MHG1-6 TaxID=2959627 RepID=UPI0021571B77|nr:ABC transporter transmembrane domain-containing protein [Marinoscillum sp. MHG1-6]
MSKESKHRLNKEGLRKLAGIFTYILPYKWTFGVGLAFLLFSSSMFMVFPYISGKLIDIASGSDQWLVNNLWQAALILFGVLLFQSIVSFFRVVLFARVTENAMANIRTDLYQKMVLLPMSFFDRNRVGDLVSRISNDVSLVQSAMSTTLAELIRQIIVLVVGVIVIFFVTPSLSLFMIGTFPVIVIIAFVFGKFIRRLSKKTQEQLSESSIVVEETIQSIQSVKSFTSEAFEVGRYTKSMKGVVKTALMVANFRAAFISFIIFAIFGAIVGIMWYGASLVQSGAMTVGDLISFILYTTFIGASIAGLGDLFGQLQKAVGASERILEVLAEQGEMELTETDNIRLSGDIVFDNVHFEYPTRTEMPVLKGINLHIENGQKAALVGHSGAGKSTIAQLLMRFYEVSSGQIRIGDTGLTDLDLALLRKNVGIVPQEVILFGGTIEENIRYGKPEATKEEIITAAKKANAYRFIESFPEGFETMVGERGVKLSGGQRQRIAIARAVLKNPSILILDEATSALDAESEKLVQEALHDLMEGRTTLIIAHRLSTIKSCDTIYVLEEGQVKESGSHTDLIERQGAYKNFVSLQMAED